MYEMPSWSWGFTTSLGTAASQYWAFYQHEIAIALMAVIVIGLITFTARGEGLFSSRKRKTLPRGSRMTGQSREAEMRVLVSDKVCDGIEDLFNRGKLDASEKLMWYERFANLCDLRDLVSSKQLTVIQRLRMSQKRRARNGPAQPVPIPEPALGPRIKFK